MTPQIDVLTHSCIRIQGDFRTIYADPFRVKEDQHDADLIFVTHEHYDHFSPADIAKVAKTTSTLVVPESMWDKAQEAAELVQRIVTVVPGAEYEVDGLAFATVPAYNIGKAFHLKEAGWVGYLLQVQGKRIYIAGDTDQTKEAEAVQCDIALLPCGGTYTMTAREAAELANRMQPELTIPTHYGSIVGRRSDGSDFAAMVRTPVQVEIQIR